MSQNKEKINDQISKLIGDKFDFEETKHDLILQRSKLITEKREEISKIKQEEE